MATVTVIVDCIDTEEYELAVRYLNWKGHVVENGTLELDPGNFRLTAFNAKQIDTFYMMRKMLEDPPPEEPLPPNPIED